ncbi:T9SS sorting signal type C domain-containing protein [Flavobacterium difficile]|uniref:T9SS sorting signal type C domain-containing protein n=1 Tax=Flavobacterium difficile TaxID=2709659 RepID=A0ABX0I8B2_9FLAO|nr:T9SS sorting signal type C domain-containing protein [Flavobacterium difficile]NHM01720.1 T9SS sorting signal type C domain-containing protein [Flavobacterium difficile]
MKKIILFFISLLSFLGFSQEASNSKRRFELLKEHTETKILYDQVANVSHATDIKKEEINPLYFMQVYHEMERADYLNRLPKLEKLEAEAKNGFAKEYVPISVLVSEFETIIKSTVENNKMVFNDNNQYEITDTSISYFNKHSIGIIAPLLKAIKGKRVVFKLSESLIFNTTNKNISKIEADFNDGLGYRILGKNSEVIVNYSTIGKKIIAFKMTLNTGEVFTHSNAFEVEEKAIPLDVSAKISQMTPFYVSPLTSITSSIPYQGVGETAAHQGRGEFQIFYDNEAGLLDKVIIVCDGFDPGDGRKVPDIYNLLNYGAPVQNLGNNVRNLGYDVVVLNFPQYTRPDGTTVVDGGVDYIQRNAKVMMELINYINANKVGNQELVVIGPSMGGLITRHALRYMEMNGMDHKTRLWLSFDSPHLGANVPIGMQHMFNYLAYDSDIADLTVRAIVDSMLKSPAARQMLIDHFEGHLLGGSLTDFDQTTAMLLPTGHPTHRNVFQTELNAMGFPQNLRKISIANGAGNGTTTGTSGMTVINGLDMPNSDGFTRALLDLNFTPAANGNIRVSRVRKQAWTFFWLTIGTGQTNARSFSYTGGLDAAPGGQFDIDALAASAGSNATLTRFLNAMAIKKFDFIPTQSALAISSTNNWFANVTGTSVSAFDAYTVPTTNEGHVTLTPSNVVFAMNEIVNNIQLKCPNTTTWNGTTWSNGLPNEDTQVTFTGNYTSSSDLDACSVSVTGTAVVNFVSGHNLKVRGATNVAATAQLKFASNANLFQIEEIANTGNVEVKRTTNLKRLDYAAWSSPVANQKLLAFSPMTLANRFYTYISSGATPTTAYTAVANPATTNFNAATGYLIRAENTMPATLTSWTGTYTGTPNNGRINPNLIHSGIGLGFNLIGNPYPSPITISSFLTGNSSRIDGTIYFWTNTNSAVSGTYTANNFATRNLTGGTAAINGTLIPDNFIQSGQGFYVNALATSPMYFTNSMRNKISNNQFINRNSNVEATDAIEPENRIWLNLSEGENKHNQILVGFVPNATNALDFGYDAKLFNNGSASLYSIAENEPLVIQAKALPFDENEKVKLGFKTQQAGLFAISVDHLDGIFQTQEIFLHDKLTNAILDLKLNPYSFISETGTFDSRFELLFKKKTNTVPTIENEILVYSNQDILTVLSSKEKISSVEVFDTLGRKIAEEVHVNEIQYSFSKLKKSNTVLLVNIVDEKGNKVSKKIIF